MNDAGMLKGIPGAAAAEPLPVGCLPRPAGGFERWVLVAVPVGGDPRWSEPRVYGVSEWDAPPGTPLWDHPCWHACMRDMRDEGGAWRLAWVSSGTWQRSPMIADPRWGSGDVPFGANAILPLVIMAVEPSFAFLRALPTEGPEPSGRLRGPDGGLWDARALVPRLLVRGGMRLADTPSDIEGAGTMAGLPFTWADAPGAGGGLRWSPCRCSSSTT